MDDKLSGEASHSGGVSSKEYKKGGWGDGIAAMDMLPTIPSSAPGHIEPHFPILVSQTLPVVKFLSFDKEYGCPIEKKYSAPIIPLKSWSSRLENINETQSLEKRYKAMSQIKQWAIKLRKHEGEEIRRIKHLLNGRFVVNDVDVCQIDNLMLKHWEEFADALLYHCQLYDGTLSSKICRPTQHILPTSIEFYGIPMQQNLCNVLVPTLSHASIDELAFNFCRLDSKDGIQFLSQILETNSNVKKIAIQNWMTPNEMSISISNKRPTLDCSPNCDSDSDSDGDYNFHFFQDNEPNCDCDSNSDSDYNFHYFRDKKKRKFPDCNEKKSNGNFKDGNDIEDLSTFCNAVANHPNLKLLKVAQLIPRMDPPSLSMILNASAKMIKLDISGNELWGVQHKEVLFDFLKQNPTLRELLLSNHNLNKTNFADLGLALRENSNLRVLNFNPIYSWDSEYAMRSMLFSVTSLNDVADSNHTCNIRSTHPVMEHPKYPELGPCDLMNSCYPQINKEQKIVSLLCATRALRWSDSGNNASVDNQSKMKQEIEHIPLFLLPSVMVMLQEDMTLIPHEIKCHVLQSLQCYNNTPWFYNKVINLWDGGLFGGRGVKLNLLFGFIKEKVELFKCCNAH